MARKLQTTHSTGWQKSVHRAELASVLRSNELIDKVLVCGEGRLEVRRHRWDDYWADVDMNAPPSVRERLKSLQSLRALYISSGHDPQAAQAYCQAYFQLLRDLVGDVQQTQLLRGLLGLECFGITWWGVGKTLAAGVMTLRHPVYLLTKLREPKAYDDAKFLPIVCPRSEDDDRGVPLFYHYRQIKMHDSPSASLLVYPAVDVTTRRESFACIEALSSALSFKPDPRAPQRAAVIADQAVVPLLRRQRCQHSAGREFSFVDIGGGSGALLGEISKRLVKNHPELLRDRKLVWSIVDVSPQDATRRTHRPELRQHMSYIDYQTMDFAAWIANESARHDHPTYDVALVCRLLNNMSRIDIESSTSPQVISELSRTRGSKTLRRFHPADCLSGTAPDCSQLAASNSRVRLPDGTTFRQASLSDYFRGLQRVSQPGGADAAGPESLAFPIRRFNKDAWMLPDGGDLLDRLSLLASFILIEDVDMTPEVLLVHLRDKGMDHLAASDATDRVRMQSSNLLCVTRRPHAEALPGRRLW